MHQLLVHQLLVHQLHRKHLNIHQYHNRDFLEDFEDNLIECFQYQYNANHQSRNHFQGNHMSKPLLKKEHLDFHKVISKLLMHLLDQKNHHKLISINYYTYMKVDHCRDFTRDILHHLIQHLYLVHQLHRKHLNIRQYHNRDFLEDFEDILIECFQYQYITNYQSRNLLQVNHMPKPLRKKEPLDFHKVHGKLLLHFLE